MQSAIAVIRRNWPVALAVGLCWFLYVRLLSPQWTIYSQYNYGWAVPFLCAYLLWQRWKERPARDAANASGAIAVLVFTALLLFPTRVIVEANPIWRAASWMMALELVAITCAFIYLAGGRSWLKHFWFPVAFYLVAVPWPSQWEAAVVQLLTRFNTNIAVELLTVLGVPALAHGNVIEVSNGMVGVDEACSGIRSLQATLMMALFFGELYRARFAQRVLLLVIGPVLALICNVARTSVLVWVASRSGIEAMEKWHDPTGVAILLGCFTALWAIAKTLRRKSSNDFPSADELSKPLMIARRWVGVTLAIWIGVVEIANAMWFAYRDEAEAGRLNWQVHWPTQHEQFRDVQLSPRVISELRFNDGRAVAWVGSKNEVWQMFYFTWGPAQTQTERALVQCARAHQPERCLPASGLELRERRGVKEFEVNGMQLPFHAYTFTQGATPLFVYFCVWEDGKHGLLANMRENTSARLRAALSGSRSLGHRVLEFAVAGVQTSAEADAAFAAELREVIQPQRAENVMRDP